MIHRFVKGEQYFIDLADYVGLLGEWIITKTTTDFA